METLFNDLLEQYRQFRTFAAWYELSTSEIKSFVENMRVRLIRLQAEHQDFPARVVDCEISAFESIAASAELERIWACYTTDSRKASQYKEIFEKIKKAWGQMTLQEGADRR